MYYKTTFTNVRTITVPNPEYQAYLNRNKEYADDLILWGSVKEYARENIPETIETTIYDDAKLEVEGEKLYELFY